MQIQHRHFIDSTRNCYDDIINQRTDLEQGIHMSGLDGEPIDVFQATRLDHVLTVAQRVKHSAAYLVGYVFLVIINLLILVWEIVYGAPYSLVLTIDLVLNLVLIFETALGMLMHKWNFFNNSGNIIELLLTSLCLVFFILFAIKSPANSEMQTGLTQDYMSEVDAFVLAVRYLFQIGRLSVLMYRSQKMTAALKQDDINFFDLKKPNDDCFYP